MALGALTDGGQALGMACARGHLALGRKDYDAAARWLEAELAGAGPLLKAFDQPSAYDPEGYIWLVARLSWTGMGWWATNQARHEEAAGWYDRVLKQKPSDVFALLGRANSHNALGELDAAQALLERALRVDPDNQYALAELALVKLNRGDDAAAEETFQAALAVEAETYTCPYEGLGLVYLRQGRVGDARAAFERAIDINPDIEYRKFNELARIYIADGRLVEARRLLEKSIENHPYDGEAGELLKTLEAVEAGGR